MASMGGVAGQEERRNGRTLYLTLAVGVEELWLFSDPKMFAVDIVSPKSGQTHEMVPDWSKADIDQIEANLSAGSGIQLVHTPVGTMQNSKLTRRSRIRSRRLLGWQSATLRGILLKMQGIAWLHENENRK
jgi:hypothetical protein